MLYFAQARDRAGCASEPLELVGGAGLEDALAAIRKKHPELETLWPHLAVAVDGALAASASALGGRRNRTAAAGEWRIDS